MISLELLLAFARFCPSFFGETLGSQRLPEVAPKVGLEPTTDRLTADCSTIELLWMPTERGLYKGRIRASTAIS